MTDRATTVPPEADQSEQAEARAPARRRGHGAKIDEAVQALRRAGRLPPNLRPVERDQRVVDWLKARGYAGDKAHGHRSDLPSPSALARYFNKRGGIG